MNGLLFVGVFFIIFGVTRLICAEEADWLVTATIVSGLFALILLGCVELAGGII